MAMDVGSETYFFWEKLENDFGIKISNHIKNSLNANGLNNAVVFNGIEKENIDNIESLIGSKLLPDLEDIAERNGQKLNMNVKSLFFGNHFASKPNDFKFTQGEKILINQIKQQVGVKGFKYFAAKKRKRNTPKLAKTAVGLIYDDAKTSEDAEDESIHAKSANSEIFTYSSENCENKLLRSANKVMNKELLATGETANVTADMIDIDRSDHESIKGFVPCAFCKEKKKVSFKHSTGNWIMSNLIIHLKKCSHRNTVEKRQTSDKDGQQLTTGNTSSSENILLLVDSKHHDDGSSETVVKSVTTPVKLKEDVKLLNIGSSQKGVFLSDSLIRQMSVQNIKMKNTLANNNGIIVERKFCASIQNILSNVSLGVCEISPDGNCLFGAIAHQLYRLKIESQQHETMIQKLRMDVVKHIEDNMADYLFIMKDLIYQKNPGEKIINLEKEIQHYLKNSLAKDKCWAGNESLHAISIMFKKNIVIINENDDPNMIIKFAPDYKESIIIFYNASRNHYESVVNVDAQVVSAIALELIKNQTKPVLNEDVVYEIEDD